ncbi:transposase [Streptomyces sp. NPDC005728]|uniref:IS701 family transposase n=1 Tax=Streptomyces sp. NPDC005728 TaxID=3157054 RepID=UPI0033E1B8CC
MLVEHGQDALVGVGGRLGRRCASGGGQALDDLPGGGQFGETTFRLGESRGQLLELPAQAVGARRGRRCLAAGLPAAWVTADEAYGQDWSFRRLLEQLDVGYVVAVPKSQQIKSLAGCWRIDQLIEEAPADAWQTLSCGDGAKGPRVYDWAAAKLPANIIFDPDPPTHHRWVMARRSLSDPSELAYYLAYAPVGVEVGELARVAGSRWAIEECFQAAKNQCGLDEYEVRRYVGWYRHITLAMLAHAFHAVLAVRALDTAKGAAETTPPASSPSPWQRPGAYWTLSCPTSDPTRTDNCTH